MSVECEGMGVSLRVWIKCGGCGVCVSGVECTVYVSECNECDLIVCVQVRRPSKSVQSTCSCPPGTIQQTEGLPCPISSLSLLFIVC